MAKRRKKQGKVDLSRPQAAPSATFGDLLRAQGVQGSGKASKQAPRIVLPKDRPNSSPLDLTKAGKVVVRRERKGRGGKGVTIVSNLNQSPSAMADLAKQMKKSLGTGARVEGNDIVVQGELTERVEMWLKKQGVARVVLGN